jgi:glycosyltransferase involved in cell wall biosynthesis
MGTTMQAIETQVPGGERQTDAIAEPFTSPDGVGVRRPKVSVCMPASRNIPWFERALRSVVTQSLRDIEVVITDDSGGDLGAVVEGFADSRIRYFPNPQRLGFAGNHCRAIELSTGDYVAFLHDDDEWETDYLASASEVLEKSPEVGLVLCGAREVDGLDNVIGLRPARMNPGLQTDPLANFLRPNFIMMLPSAGLFRRIALQTNKRPWPDVVAADATMFIDLAYGSWKVYYVAFPLVRYRVHEHQISAGELDMRHALVTVWSSYKFSEHQYEVGRRKILAQCLIARAGAWLRTRKFLEAREDLVEARRTDPATLRARRLVLRAATVAPFLLSPLLKLRESLPKKHRHAGT